MLDQNFDEGHFQHRNEPGHHFIYLYDYAGNPSKTQEKIWEHTPLNYKNAPDGLSGNDDCGQMSAWYIFSSMGFYPVRPGSGEYVVGSPLFPRIEFDLPDPYNNKLTIIAEGVEEGKKYIKVVQDTGVFCFIAKEDFKHFKKGDILKAAGWNAPALNSPRGNVLKGNYPIQWTGPLYLK